MWRGRDDYRLKKKDPEGGKTKVEHVYQVEILLFL